MKKVVIICPYPFNHIPSQRFRFEQYLALLEENNFKVTFLSLYDQNTWLAFNRKKTIIQRTPILFYAIFVQTLKIFSVIRKDIVFIHREILQVGPPVLEWIICKVFRKKVIFDFDDAIWLTDNSQENYLEKILRWRSKVGSICKWSHKVSVGNEYLAAFARQYNAHVVINPTTIDTKNLHNPKLFSNLNIRKNEITIGWTGSRTTLKYLKKIESVLIQIQHKFPTVKFLIIADRPPSLDIKNLEFTRWTKETEIEDLLKIDIGVMPLPDDKWARGKCGFKILQYMALEIPSIASPVGVNNEIIEHGANGFLCSSNEEWLDKLEELITNEELRKQMGQNGRKKVVNHYSIESNASIFLSFFE